MPDFSRNEETRESIVLWRLLRGSGAQVDGLLDHVISLEAALPPGTQTELAYKFRLYGTTRAPIRHSV
jgi:hypothetical protein